MNNQESGKRSADTPKPTIIIPIALYLVLYFLTTYTARSGEVITFGSSTLPLSALAGAITSLSGIVLVHLVLHHKKAGFIIALALIIFPMPSLVNWILRGNVSSLPGLFTNILTIIMLVIIMINHVRMEKRTGTPSPSV